MELLEDRVLPAVTAISQAATLSDTAAGNVKGPASVSQNGQLVVYTDTAANLVTAQQMDPQTVSDVFLYNRTNGATTLVSHASNSATTTAHGTSKNAVISADGNWIAYASNSDNLVAGETLSNDTYYVSIGQVTTGSTFKVSYAGQTTSPIPYNDTAAQVQTILQGLAGVGAGNVSVTGSGGSLGVFTITFTGALAHGASSPLTADLSGLTPTTTALVFPSFAGGHNEFLCDQYWVFLYNVQTGATTILSHAAADQGSNFQTTMADGTSGILTGFANSFGGPGSFQVATQNTSVSISGDGKYVTYLSTSVHLVKGQVDVNPTDLLGHGFPLAANVFVYNNTTDNGAVAGSNDLVSFRFGSPVNSDGAPTTPGDYTSFVAVISQDGQAIAFGSQSTDLAQNQQGSTTDGHGPGESEQIFVSNRPASSNWGSAVTSLVSHNTHGNAVESVISDGTDVNDFPAPAISANHLWIAYFSTNIIITTVSDPNVAQGDNYYLYDNDSTDAAGYRSNKLITHVPNNPNAAGSATVTASPKTTAASPAISDDGRFVAFVSQETNLTSTATAAGYNYFVYDRTTQNVTRINHLTSLPASEIPASAAFPPLTPSISGDGRYIAYLGIATNENALLADKNSPTGLDVFLYDQQNASNPPTLVSHQFGTGSNLTTTGTGQAYVPVVSDDGSTILYLDVSNNLLPATIPLPSVHTGQDLNAAAPGDGVDLYAFNRTAAAPAGNGDSDSAPIGSNSTSTLHPNLPTKTANGESEVSPVHAVSDDGNYTVFISNAPNLVANEDDSNLSLNVYLYNKSANTVTLLSHNSGLATKTGNNESTNAVISGDGKTILFYSLATDLISVAPPSGSVQLYLYDNDSSSATFGQLKLISHTQGSTTQAANGTQPFGEANGLLGTSTLLYSTQLAQGLALPSLSADGKFIVYLSNANNLSGANTGAATLNAFLYDRGADTNTMISHATGVTTTANAATDTVSISSDGTTVAFTSKATNLLASSITTTGDQLYVWSRTTNSNTGLSAGQTVLASHAASSTTTAASFGAASSLWGPLPASLSTNGTFVAYYFGGSNLVSGQAGTAASDNVFRYDVKGNTNLLVSHANASATTAGDNPTNAANQFEASGPIISGNGEFIAYANNSTNLLTATLTGQNGQDNVYRYDANQADVTKQNLLVSNNGSATAADQFGGTSPSMTADGRFVSFIDVALDTTADVDCTFRQGSVRLFDANATGQPNAVGGAFDLNPMILIGATLAPTNLAANYSNNTPILVWDGPATNTAYGVTGDLNGNTDVFLSAPSSSSSGQITLTAAPDITGKENTAIPGPITVATIHDTNSSDPAGQFAATVGWGDGSSSSGSSVTISGSPGSFTITVPGGHTYLEEGIYPITVTLTQVPSGATVPPAVQLHAAIADVALTGNGGFTVTGVEGSATGSQQVAAFTDPVWTNQETAADYSATIDWGDGSATSSGTISGSNGSFTVTGNHTYADENGTPFKITVTIHHGDGDGSASPDLVVTSTANVSDPAVNGTGGFTVNAVEGTAFSGQTVATFKDPGGAEVVGDYSATINWGDGTAASAGTITGPDASGVFTVTGGHTYADELGTPFTITVTIKHENATPDAVVTSTAKVTDPPVNGTGGFTFNAVENTASPSQTVATFKDPAGAEALGDYGATINWGDGTATTTGNITGPDAGGTFTVSGSHTYAEEGTFTITVTIKHDSATPDASVTSTAKVTDPAVNGTGGFTLNGVENSPISAQTLATFKDPAGAEALGDYGATIAWGDGTTSAGTISGPDAGGSFTVTGGHTYTEEGNFTITVTIKHDAATPDAVVTSSAVIADPAVNGSGGFTVNTVEGQAFTGQTLATFKDPAGAEALGDYGATIAWGDGSTSAGSISGPDAGGTFTVTGGHTYTEEGNYTITVTIKHDSATPDASVTSSAVVTDPPVNGTGSDFSAIEGTAVTGQTVATFKDPGGKEALGDYGATIVWGDGSSSSGTITGPDASGNFSVTGGHTYTEEGKFTVTVTIKHDLATPDAVVTATATVADPKVVGSGVNFNAVEGLKFTGQQVATFTDPGGAEALGDYSATINWGDGSSSAGTIGSGFTVTGGDHTYTEEGKFTVTITVKHDSAPDAVITGTATVADVPVNGTGGFTVTGLEGQVIAGQTLATFTDPAGAETIGDYSAVINWGDGTAPGAGTISNAGGTFTVRGAHAYAEEGNYTITITIKHDSATPDAVVTSSALVADQAVTGTGVDVSAVEGLKFAGQTVATITDPAGAEPVSDYGATINWGDGSSSAGTIVASGGSLSVTGDHLYVEEGKYTITVTIKHDSATPDAVATSTATVDDPAVAGTGGFIINSTEGAPFKNQVVATFTDPAGAEVLGDYSAAIDWGDGTTSAGTVSGPDGSGTFTVTGDHTYAEEGKFTFTVTLKHDIAPDAQVTGTANVLDPPVVANPAAAPINGLEGELFKNETVATFTDPAGPETPADYSATINWGDGTTSAGTITGPDASGTFSVEGSHAYVEEGKYALTITIHHDEASPDAVVNGTAIMDDPGVVIQGGVTLSVAAADPNTVQATVMFTDPGGPEVVSDYSADITWAFGITTAATISGPDANGTFTATGTHTYAAIGKYKVGVTVHHETAPDATAGGIVAITGGFGLGGANVPGPGPNQVSGVSVGSQTAVNQIYQSLLGRVADSTGLSGFGGLLDQGTNTAAVVQAIQSSPEYHQDVVETTYNHLLDRSADPSGLSSWMAFLASGGTVQQMELFITGSPEYYQKRGGGTDLGFLSAIYADLFNRQIDPSGLQTFQQALAQGQTPIQVADALITSDEFLGDVVNGLYHRLLHRDADAAGLAGFVADLRAGMTENQVIAAIVSSPEYQSHM
jgi:hypothetical protein